MTDIGQGLYSRARLAAASFRRSSSTAVAPFSKGVTEAAARGWDPISANFLMPAWVKSHWPKYAEGCETWRQSGRYPAKLRVAKKRLCLPRTPRRQKAYATDPDGPYVYYYRSLFTKLKKNGRIELFKTRRDQPDDEVDAGSDLRQVDHLGNAGKASPINCWLFRMRSANSAPCSMRAKDWGGPRVGTAVHDPDG